MKAGSVTRRCGCRDPKTGKQYGKACPQARKKGHGTWTIRQELAPTADDDRRLFRRTGYASADDAQKALDQVRALLAIPESDDAEGREHISALLVRVVANKEPIPDYEDTKRRLRTGQSLTSKTTVGEWLDQWMADENDEHRKATEASYESHVRLYLKPHLGEIRLDRLQVGHVVKMFQAIEDQNEAIQANNADRKALELQIKQTRRRAGKKRLRDKLGELPPYRRPVGPSSRQRIRATLRAALNDAIAQQWITFNAAAHVKITAKQPRPIVWTAERVEQWRQTGIRPSPVMVWTPEQTGQFLAHVAEDRLYALWHLLTFRGLRRGEACGLRPEDLNLDAGTLDVAKQLTEVDYEVAESDPKTDAGERTIALDAGTTEMLRTHRVRQARERLSWGPAWVDSGRVFTRENGEQLRPSWVTDRFAALAAEAGLPPIRLHDLRHGAATLALAGGAEMKTVQDMLGHSSITITSDVYTSVLPDVAREAAEAAARLIPRQVTGTDGHTSGTHHLTEPDQQSSTMA
ncbi:site-specific integrase [Amycolatopsis cihanbeyliensis]|uniref:Site-specific recombinase XerD n=1 Tax=Amycolatopsis cihanbeyliensis TaxID=1128664 RepID=A0A542DMF5_AMYCI|nr:site-specific integrase [Amycolatopsis cihanbeyliensis]TQJ04268.1 site-specific recombinase XerD [Amycolatopsis cihanbeyliensis]